YLNPYNVDDFYVPNYTVFTSDGFRRDPETIGANRIAANMSWTYPDMHNMVLGALDADGVLRLQSFHRPWIPAALGLPGMDWTTTAAPIYRYLTLRPHPNYHPLFPQPDDLGGDVRCLDSGKGVPDGKGGYYKNDAFWMDLGFPIQTAKNGK